MATISELNIRLGLITKDFDRNLAKVERDLRNAGSRLSRLGSDLTIAISAPLAAFGVSAIQAAGDVEALRLAMRATFEGAGRSIQEADAELENLRKSALAPGLDFEQAVKASVRLQNVGFTAESARSTIEQLANTIATTGGTAQDLDEVTNQFSQMIGKGKVFQDDIKIILGRMPKLAALMKETFGTTTAEGLNALGVDARTFVDTMVAKMGELPRVTGGIKNSIVNLGAAVRNSLAGIGEEINRVFDLGKASDDLSARLAGLVDWFKGLSDGTKRIIVEFGLVLVAVGPMVKLFGALYGGSAQLVGIFRSLVQASVPLQTFFVGMTQSTKSVTGYLVEFGKGMLGAGQAALKMRVAIIAATGGLAAIVLGIAGAVYLLSERFDAAEFTTQQFNQAQKTTIDQAAKETAELNKNFAILRSVTASTDDRKKAVAALQAAYPDYLKNINLEKASSAELTQIQKGLNDEILRGVAERQKAAAVNAVYEKQAQILLRIQQIQRTGKITTGEATLINTGDLIRNGSNAAAVIEKLQKQVKALSSEANTTAKDFDKAFGLASREIDPLLQKEYDARSAAEDARDAFLGFGDKVEKATGSTKVFTGSIAAAGDGLSKKMRAALAGVNANLDAFDERLKLYGPSAESAQQRNDLLAKSIDRLLKAGFSATSEQVQRLRTELAASASVAGAAGISLGDLAGQFQAAAGGSAQMNAAIAAGAGMTDKMRAELAAVGNDLAAFADNIRQNGPAAETAAQRNDLLRASIDRLQQAGFSAVSTQIQALNAELKNTGADSASSADSVGNLATQFRTAAAESAQINASIAAGAALSGEMRAALAAVGNDLAAFAESVRQNGPAAETAAQRNDLLTASMARLQQAGFSATSSQVQALNTELNNTSATSAAAADNLTALAGKFAGVAQSASALNAANIAGNALTERQRAALGAVGESLAAFDARLKQYGPSADTAKQRNDLLAASIDRLLKAGFSATGEQVQALNAHLAAGTEVTDELKRAYDALRESWSKPVDFKVPEAPIPTLPQANPLGVGEQQQQPGEPAPSVANTLSLGALNEGLTAANALTEGLQNLATNGMTPVQAIMQGLKNDTITFNEAFTAMAENVSANGTAVQQIALGLGQSFMQAASDGATSFADFTRSFIRSAAKVIKTQIQLAVTNAALSALQNTPYPYNLILAGVAGAAAAALFEGLVNKITAPKLAAGGVITKPTFAMLGEYPGASSNPEIAAPESKLRSIFRSEQGPGNLQLEGVVKGDDLYILTKRAEATRNRFQ